MLRSLIYSLTSQRDGRFASLNYETDMLQPGILTGGISFMVMGSPRVIWKLQAFKIPKD